MRMEQVTQIFSQIPKCWFDGDLLYYQLIVNYWFGARWFGILGVHPSNNPFYKGILSETKPPGPKPTINH